MKREHLLLLQSEVYDYRGFSLSLDRVVGNVIYWIAAIISCPVHWGDYGKSEWENRGPTRTQTLDFVLDAIDDYYKWKEK